jgi:hypothetical protein
MRLKIGILKTFSLTWRDKVSLPLMKLYLYKIYFDEEAK